MYEVLVVWEGGGHLRTTQLAYHGDWLECMAYIWNPSVQQDLLARGFTHMGIHNRPYNDCH